VKHSPRLFKDPSWSALSVGTSSLVWAGPSGWVIMRKEEAGSLCKKALMSISSQQMGSTRMGSTTNLDFRTWAQRTHETQEEQLKQKVPVAEKEKHTSYRNSICRTSFWWVSTVANLIVTWYFEPARSSTNSVECHHHKTNGRPSWKPISRSGYYRQQWLIQHPYPHSRHTWFLACACMKHGFLATKGTSPDPFTSHNSSAKRWTSASHVQPVDRPLCDTGSIYSSPRDYLGQ